MMVVFGVLCMLIPWLSVCTVTSVYEQGRIKEILELLFV